METNKKDFKILSDMHRLFSELAELQGQLTQETQRKMLNMHNEFYAVSHCIRWGEIAISEVRDKIERQ